MSSGSSRYSRYQSSALWNRYYQVLLHSYSYCMESRQVHDKIFDMYKHRRYSMYRHHFWTFLYFVRRWS